jgi:hypothetical protein
MQQHVKVLAILHIVLGGLGVLAALIAMAFFGGLAGLAGISTHGDQGMGVIAGGVIGLIGAVIMIVVLVISVPGLVAGIGLLSFRPWARILTIILSALELPGFPLHTALGIYGLWVLLSNEGTALFERSTQGYARPVS